MDSGLDFVTITHRYVEDMRDLAKAAARLHIEAYEAVSTSLENLPDFPMLAAGYSLSWRCKFWMSDTSLITLLRLGAGMAACVEPIRQLYACCSSVVCFCCVSRRPRREGA